LAKGLTVYQMSFHYKENCGYFQFQYLAGTVSKTLAKQANGDLSKCFSRFEHNRIRKKANAESWIKNSKRKIV
jgi:hypothetical protein